MDGLDDARAARTKRPPWLPPGRTAPPRARKTRGRAIAAVLASLVVGALLVAAGAAAYVYQAVNRPGPLLDEAVVVIPAGAGGREIARELATAGVIANANLFVVAARVLAGDGPLHAGEFAFPAGVSTVGAVRLLQSGRTVVHTFTVPEGLTTAQIFQRLAAAEALSGEPPPAPGEGMLLPETYHFSRGDERAEMVARMATAMSDTLAELWPRRAENLPFDDPHEAMTLASIVEKETAVADERARVAAVFVNRLKRGMKLQSDPTVVYALTGGQGPLGRDLQRDDLEIEHPYNTYHVAGLPPGPIANPGRASIEAVLQPLDTNELYFVADGNGGHAFAETFEEHQENVARWRRLQRD